jgi:GH35 family endo-1,4-beta-xylanase
MMRTFTLFLILISFVEFTIGQTPIAAGKSKFLGCCYSTAQTNGFASYFNQVTPENAGKWGALETSDGNYDFTTVDAAREFAKTNSFSFRFHVLVWGNQQPTWLKAYTDEQKVIKIKAWFQAVANHYDGSTNAKAKLEYIEVVNEALNDPPDNTTGSNPTDAGSGDYVNALKSLNTELNTTPGTYDWVVNSFKLARQYFTSDTKLVINDYGVENDAAKMAQYINIINLLKADNLVDAVGIQCHAFSTKMYGSDNTALLNSNLNTLAAAGLPIMVTEMDIDGVTGATQAEKDANQLAEYQRVFSIYWNHPSVIGITMWGFRNGMWRSSTEAYLINPNTGAERPALSNYLNTIIRASDPCNSFVTVNCATSAPSVSNESFIDFKVYPNPSADGCFTVEIKDNICNSKTLLVITDIKGSEIIHKKVTDNIIEIDQKIAPGTYFINVINDVGVSVKKIVVQNQ